LSVSIYAANISLSVCLRAFIHKNTKITPAKYQKTFCQKLYVNRSFKQHCTQKSTLCDHW